MYIMQKVEFFVNTSGRCTVDNTIVTNNNMTTVNANTNNACTCPNATHPKTTFYISGNGTLENPYGVSTSETPSATPVYTCK
jgi:hypothetical protein